jgi:hypothetical protein
VPIKLKGKTFPVLAKEILNQDYTKPYFFCTGMDDV